ncbi:MAG: DNA-binding protein [Nitrospinae bacterium]|nr:DNA-binding protein [Nitrospinota bacterium]
MEKTDSKGMAVCDAGPIIHLDELDSLDIISDFHPLIIPKSVETEIIRHRQNALHHPGIVLKVIEIISPPEPRLLILSKALSLDKGEIESLSLIQENPDAIFMTDDAAARLAGEELGYKVHGTIGIILRAIRKKMRTPKDVLELLNRIPKETTLFLRSALLEKIIQKVEREYSVKKDKYFNALFYLALCFLIF